MPPAIATPKTLLSFFQFAKSLHLINQLHAQIIANGYHHHVFFGSNLANAYIESGSLKYASKSFDQIKHKNTHSWNTIISGYSKHKLWSDVISLFNKMRSRTRNVDSFNLVFATNAFSEVFDLLSGNLIHSLIIKSGFERDAYVVPALLNLYTELGCVEDARKVFDFCPDKNLAIYGQMLNAYLKFSREARVFEMFSVMRYSGFEVDAFTLVSLIRACGNVGADREARACHGLCVKMNLIDSCMYLKTSLVQTYLKCGLFDMGLELFEEIPDKDVVLWTVVIGGLARTSRAAEAIGFFRLLVQQGMILNSIILDNVILACSHLGSLQLGASVHCYMLRNGVELDVVNYTSFIDMYARCGCIVIASRVFNQAPWKNVHCWSAMINAFGAHGLYSEAISAFDQMILENKAPNSVTFISVLWACSHSGRVEEGLKYFRLMSSEYGIVPQEGHYNCMVDLLTRAGKIREALSFISCMPMDPGPSAWAALLGACRMDRLVELAEEVASKLLPLETDKSSVYVLLSNVYANAGMWDMVNKIRSEMSEKVIVKTAGITSLKLDEKLSAFGVNETCKLYRCLDFSVDKEWNKNKPLLF